VKRRHFGGAILLGLIVTSLTLYWAADTGSTVAQVVLLCLLGGLALAAAWTSK